MEGNVTWTLMKDASSAMTTTPTSPTSPTTPLKRQTVVLFIDESGHFDTQRCVNNRKFSVQPGEEYIMLLVSRGQLSTDKTVPTSRRRHLGYILSLKHQELKMIVTVPYQTSLTLMKQLDFFKMMPFFMTPEQFNNLIVNSSIN
jgi:hypothetical protein